MKSKTLETSLEPGTSFNSDNFLQDNPEVFAARGAEGSGDIFPDHVSRSNSVSCSTASLICIPHFFHYANLLHE